MKSETTHALTMTAMFAVAGAFAGAAMRILLARLRRGTRVRAPCCELVIAGLWAVLGWRFGVGAAPAWWLPVPLLLTVFAVPLVAVDLRHRRLPDALTLTAYPALGGVLVAAAVSSAEPALLFRAVCGAVLFAGAHAVVYLLAPASLGAGDVKLSGSLGGVLGAVGWPALVVAAVLATVITACLALTVFLGARTSRPEWRSGVPHGPGLLAGAWLVAAFPGTGLDTAT